MKKLNITGIALLLLFTFQQGFSQGVITKGSSLVGISAAYSRGETENTVPDINVSPDDFTNFTNSSFSFRPTYAYALKDNFMVGGSLVLRNTTNEQTSISQNNGSFIGQETTNYGLSIFARWYFDIKGNFGAFVQSGSTVFWGTTKVDRLSTLVNTGEILLEDEDKLTNRGQSLEASLGLYYTFNERFLIQTTLGNLSVSSSSSNDKDGRNNNDSFGETKSSSVAVNFVNAISFDQVLTINYLF